MIYATLETIDRYSEILHGIDKVIDYARELNKADFVKGRVDVDGERVYLNLAEYETHPKEGALSEAHRVYADVMVMVEGTETVYVKPASHLSRVMKKYDSSIEAILAKTDDDAFGIRLTEGDVLVLFPEDAHTPGCDADGVSHVKKIIGKVML